MADGPPVRPYESPTARVVKFPDRSKNCTKRSPPGTPGLAWSVDGVRSSPVERAVEIFALVHFTVIGFSHIFAPRAWVQFYVWLRGKGEPGVFVVGSLSLWFGSIIVAFHNVWSGLPAVLTVMGWAQVGKSALYLVFPRVGLKMLGRVSEDRAHHFIYGGVVSLALAALLGWLVLR